MHDQQMRSADQLAETLVRSSLVSPGEVDRANRWLAGDTNAASLADQLISSGALTDYQAATLLRKDVTSLICGDYVILDKLGEGSMGQVFKAVHRHLERIVALKVLTRFAAVSPETVERFQREAKVIAALDHPNIVQAYDARIDEPQAYLIMEFVDGVDLATLVDREGAVPVRLACQYILQAARGLAHAHSKHIVHRDVKPSNLIVDSAGIVKVLDLGVAKLQAYSLQDESAHRRLTDEGQVLGTVAFMAPEQAEDSHSADERADIYSLGCTLFYLLTESLPYAGTTIFDTVKAHRMESAPSLLALCPGASHELQEVFEKAVAKDVNCRYMSMDEFSEDLENYIKNGHARVASSGRPSQTTGADTPRRWKSKRARPSANTIPIRDGDGMSPGKSMPQAKPAKPKKAAAALKRRLPLIGAVCSVVILTVIVGTVALSNRKPTKAATAVQSGQSPNPKPTLVKTKQDSSPDKLEPNQKTPNENSEIVRASLRSSSTKAAKGLPDKQQPAKVKSLLPSETKPPDEVPALPEAKSNLSSTDPEKSDPMPVKPKGPAAAIGRDEHDPAPANPFDFALTMITGKREEKLAEIDAAVKRLESFIKVRDRVEARRSEPPAFVAAITVGDQVFEVDTPESALEVCRALQSAKVAKDARDLVSQIAGGPVDMAEVARQANAYVQQWFPGLLDQWVEEKERMPQERDVRRIVMKAVALGKSDGAIPAYIDYRPTSLELNSLLGEILERKSDQFKRALLTRPPPPGHRPPPPPRRKPPR